MTSISSQDPLDCPFLVIQNAHRISLNMADKSQLVSRSVSVTDKHLKLKYSSPSACLYILRLWNSGGGWGAWCRVGGVPGAGWVGCLVQGGWGAWCKVGGVPGAGWVGCLVQGGWGAWCRVGGVPGARWVGCLVQGGWGAWCRVGGVPGARWVGCLVQGG